MDGDTPLKRCPTCGEHKPATAEFFHRNKRTKSGWCVDCKSCTSTRAKLWYTECRKVGYEPGLDRDTHKRCLTCKENKPATAEFFSKDNRVKDGLSKRCKACELALEELRLVKHKKPLRIPKAPPYVLQGIRIANMRRRSRVMRLPFFWDAKHESAMYAIWDYRCAYCDCDLMQRGVIRHADHYIPVSLGSICPGTIPANMLPACSSCNMNKSNALPESWIRWTFPDRADEIIARIEAYFKEVQPSKRDRRAAMRQPKQLSFDFE